MAGVHGAVGLTGGGAGRRHMHQAQALLVTSHTPGKCGAPHLLTQLTCPRLDPAGPCPGMTPWPPHSPPLTSPSTLPNLLTSDLPLPGPGYPAWV